MTREDKALPGLLVPEATLHRLVDQLAVRFAGVFARETIDRYVFESYTAPARTATVTAHLPVLAGRFATERLTALAQAKGVIDSDVCEILFVCVHNAGRSQMAAALMAQHGGDRVHVRSAGSQPTASIDAAVVEAMAEVGVEFGAEFPKPLTDDVARAADVVVTMGCGDACPVYPGKRYLDWQVRDPAGHSVGEVRAIPRRHRRSCTGAACRTAPRWRLAMTAPAHRPRGDSTVADKPSVLFVCVHNAGRSQMAAGWLRHLAGDAVEVRSAGSMPGDRINPSAVEAMREVGIDITDQRPKVLTTEAVEASDVVITMGCGDACPIFPGKRYVDWALEDPAGKGVESVRPIRDGIETRIRGLLTELQVPSAPGR